MRTRTPLLIIGAMLACVHAEAAGAFAEIATQQAADDFHAQAIAIGKSGKPKPLPPAEPEYKTWKEYQDALPPLRALSGKRNYTLRILYLEDERLPKISSQDRSSLYKKAEVLLAKWFGYRVSINEVGQRSLAQFFQSAETSFSDPKNAEFILGNEADLDSEQGLAKVKDAVYWVIENLDAGKLGQYLALPKGATKENAMEEAFNLFKKRLTDIRGIKTADGGSFFTKALLKTQSFPHWNTVLTELREADFILTNSMIAGPDAGMPIYVIIRGGVTTGLVDNSMNNPYQAAGMVGLFPFLSDDKFFLKERGAVPEAERLDVIATFWMHELGHFFLRYSEIYGQDGCVHVAPKGLVYYSWHQSIRASGNRCSPRPKTLERF